MSLNLRKNQSHAKGFTLLEIIIVIVIIGILAGTALPKLFSLVERSHSAEALMMAGTIRRSIERCWLATDSDWTFCGGSFNGLDIDNPNTSSGRHFNYSINVGGLGVGETPGAMQPLFLLSAESINNPNDDHIEFQSTLLNGFQYEGFGAFSGVINN